MKAAFLKLDDAMAGQPVMGRRAQAEGARTVEAADLGPALRLWSRPPALTALTERVRRDLPASEGSRLVFAGSGDFHHVTPTLVRRALEARPGPVTLVHVDNHPDWVRYANGLHCGSWVGAAASIPGVAKVVTLGVCSSDVGAGRMRAGNLALVGEGRHVLFAYDAPDGTRALSIVGKSHPTIAALGLDIFRELLLDEIETEAVYVTIDKDALRREDAATNWDQGRMSLDELEQVLEAVFANHEIIGADVVGDWSRPVYGDGLIAAALKRGEAALDQPWRTPANSNLINQATNLRLLSLFEERA